MKTPRILMVDDDADFVKINQTVLEKEGFEVFTAYNAEEGEQLCHEVKPDLIILDVMMNTITDGFFATYNLRKEEDTKRIPILMVSSVNETVPYRFEPDDQYLPVNRFLDKPVSPEDLVNNVREMLAVGEQI